MKIIFSVLPLLVLLLTSCASSERLTRMSGGVITEYSAPKQYRLRSEKYQAKSRNFSSGKKISHGKAAGLDDTLINIWPFFFASDNYWCALWPMIDCDPYGFAVRPFFNKEGNDCSILFPLSSWNLHNKSGWIANFVWEPNAFGFIPLTWQSNSSTKSTYYYTPLFFLQKNKWPLTYNKSRRTDYSCFCALAYGQKEHFVKIEDLPHSWLFTQYNNTGTAFQNEWAYRYRNSKKSLKMPKNKKELEQLKEELFKQRKEEISQTTGFFPLFHFRSDTKGSSKFTAGLLLAEYSQNKHLSNWNILCGLAADCTFEQKPEIFSGRYCTNSIKEQTTLSMPLFLTRYKRQIRYSGKRYQQFASLKENSWKESFSEALPRLQKRLKEISPNAEMPEEVKDWNTFYLYKAELAAKEKFSTEEHKEIFAGPFFFTKQTPLRKNWIVPLLLSWGLENKTDEKKEFVSIPLLTFIKNSKNKGYSNIAPPLICWSNFERKSHLHKPIYSNDCKWSGKYGAVEEINQYAALGLFYRGRHAFTVAKKNIDHKKAEFIRKNTLSLGTNYQHLRDSLKNIAERQRQAEAWQTKNKIEYYQKLIRFEELKEEKQKLAERKKDYDALRKKVMTSAKELGTELSESDFSDKKSAEKAVEKLMRHTTELRWKEDIGSGLFFGKEKFYNQDCNWHFCRILAGGSKNGQKETCHILHLLYRKRKEGNRTETIFFPFISHVKEGNDERTSFMWRLFSIGKRNGKTEGHIFFIPFGGNK